MCYEQNTVHGTDIPLRRFPLLAFSISLTHPNSFIHIPLHLRLLRQFGTHAPGRMSYGHSMIIGPFGETLAMEETGEESYEEGRIITAEVDLSALEQIRKEIPLWDQRRYDIYPQL